MSVSELTLTLTGTGTSAGIPMIACDCEVCTSNDPKDRRDRCGAMIEFIDDHGVQRRLLIDTPPELRLQMVRHEVFTIDAVLYTHNHADHIGGLDDLRRFSLGMDAPLPIHAEASVLEWLEQRFDYIFQSQNNVNQSFVAQLSPQVLNPDPQSPLHLFDLDIIPIRLMHGNLPVLGFRFGNIAYCTDVSLIPESSYELLKDLDILVIDALRYDPHSTHFNVDQAMAEIEKIQPRRAVFTHIAHQIMHAELEARLPNHIEVGYDGMRLISRS